MKKRKNNGTRQRRSKGFKIALYSAFTVLLTCLIVTGYYLISNGVIFGKFTVKSDTYTMGDVTEADQQKIIVTQQNQEGAVPLTSQNENLPKIPPANGTTKGTKDNPFVILEVVPELSQQTLSYMVDSEEKGLPFNPVELGIKFCNEKSNQRGFLTQDKRDIDRGNLQNIIPNNYGYFGNLFQSGIDVAVGDDKPYYGIDFLYNFEMYSSDFSQEDFKNKTVHELFEQNPEAFVLAFPDKFSATMDAEGNITSAVCIDNSLRNALEEKDTNGNYTDRNWVKTEEVNNDITKSYKLTVSAESGLTDEDFNTLTMQQLAEKYPALFAKDDNNRDIPANILAKNNKWAKEKKDLEERKTSGYFIKREKGKGQFTLSGQLVNWNSNGLSAIHTGTDTDMWDYVDSTAYPSETFDVEKVFVNDWNKFDAYKFEQAYTTDDYLGCYLRMNYDEANANAWNAYWHTVNVKRTVYAFDYAKYKYTLKYAGLRINDILKYSLFTRDSEEDYEKLYLQVIVVTPDMINEMDANDTPETIDYIERADLYYISEYYDGFNLMADNLTSFVDFYNLYCGGSGEKLNGDASKLKSFYDTDLEWWDCLKIIKRLSTNMNLPLMQTKFIANMAMHGVDGSLNTDIYIDENNKHVDVTGNLNNLGKLFFITVQFDLLDIKSEEEANIAPGDQKYRRTFMNDLFPKLKVMKLNEDQQDNSAHPAQYTGYYERTPLSDSTKSEDYKKRCYYLWNKFTFFPAEPELTGIFGNNDNADMVKKLVEKYGYLRSYFYDNTFQNASGEVNRGGGSANGSDGMDDKNVTFAGNGQNDNINMSIPTNVNTLNRMLEILRNILDNYDKNPGALAINLQENPKEYTRMKNDQVLLDYDSKAQYKNANKEIDLKFIFANQNNEDAVITKMSLVKEEESTTGLEPRLEDSERNTVQKEEVSFSNGTQPLEGYKIAAEDSSTIHFVPIKRADWQNGYNILKIEWTTRMKVERPRKNNTPKITYYDRKGTNYVYIGERGLFNLE